LWAKSKLADNSESTVSKKRSLDESIRKDNSDVLNLPPHLYPETSVNRFSETALPSSTTSNHDSPFGNRTSSFISFPPPLPHSPSSNLPDIFSGFTSSPSQSPAAVFQSPSAFRSSTGAILSPCGGTKSAVGTPPHPSLYAQSSSQSLLFESSHPTHPSMYQSMDEDVSPDNSFLEPPSQQVDGTKGRISLTAARDARRRPGAPADYTDLRGKYQELQEQAQQLVPRDPQVNRLSPRFGPPMNPSYKLPQCEQGSVSVSSTSTIPDLKRRRVISPLHTSEPSAPPAPLSSRVPTYNFHTQCYLTTQSEGSVSRPLQPRR
jgi:hypothetical protein